MNKSYESLHNSLIRAIVCSVLKTKFLIAHANELGMIEGELKYLIKIRILSLLFVLLLLTNLPALADTAPKLVTPKYVSLIDMGHIKVTNFDSFVDFLDDNPQLKQVNMFESRLKA